VTGLLADVPECAVTQSFYLRHPETHTGLSSNLECLAFASTKSIGGTTLLTSDLEKTGPPASVTAP
jgi:hypothetical protein